MVSVYVFLVVEDNVFTVSVEVPVVGFGVNVTVEPEGWPVRLNVTDPAKPFTLLTVTVYVAVFPRRTDWEVGFVEREKSAARAVTVTLAVPFTPPLDAVTVNGPPLLDPAVNTPAWLMPPPPLTDQENAGWGLIGLPYWS